MTDRELDHAECVDLLGNGGVGRIALCLPSGPRIYPVNFALDGTAIVFRTAVYSELGSALVKRPAIAFEADHIDAEEQRGWSVMAQGFAEPVDDPTELQALRPSGRLMPWAAGTRNLYVRLAWRTLTGRRVGR